MMVALCEPGANQVRTPLFGVWLPLALSNESNQGKWYPGQVMSSWRVRIQDPSPSLTSCSASSPDPDILTNEV
jgi:hypothetical protein